MKKTKPKVFINYAEEDFEYAKKLYYDLKRYSVDPWLDKFSLLAGEDWRISIEHAIKSSDYFICLLSNRSVNKKGYLQKEIRIGLDILDEFPPLSQFIIPVRLDDCSPEHAQIKRLNWVNMFLSWENGLLKILDVIGDIGTVHTIVKLKVNKRETFKSTTWVKGIRNMSGLLSVTLVLKNGYSARILDRVISYGEFIDAPDEVVYEGRIHEYDIGQRESFSHVYFQYEPALPSVKTRALYDKDDLKDYAFEAPLSIDGLQQVFITNVQINKKTLDHNLLHFGDNFSHFREPASVMSVFTNSTPDNKENQNIFSLLSRISVNIGDQYYLDIKTDELIFKHEYGIGATLGHPYGFHKWITFYRIIGSAQI